MLSLRLYSKDLHTHKKARSAIYVIFLIFVVISRLLAMDNSFFHIIARAGAGTGKTYSLVENYLSSLLGTDASGIKKRPQNILALTFTHKAAHEMRLRVAHKLNELIDNSDDYDKDELKRIVRALPHAPIATFHSFCATLIRKEAHVLNLFDQFAILSPHEEYKYAKKILKNIIINHIKNNHLLLRNLVARFRLSPGFISFGLINNILECYNKLAEQGIKTTNLKYNKQNNINNNILALQNNLDNFIQLKNSATTLKRLYEIKDALDIFRESVKDNNEYHCTQAFEKLRFAARGNFGNKEARQELVAAIINTAASLVDHFVAEDEHVICEVLHDFHEEFNNYKQRENKISYADLLIKSRDALADNIGIRKRVKEQFAHVLVDEYQDTSPIQEQIIALICENKKQHTILDHIDFKYGSSLFVVGDKKQSIYGFRGADINIFDRMFKIMKNTHPSGINFTQKLLTTNRRSASKLLDLINLISQEILYDQGYDKAEKLQAWRTDYSGKAELWLSSDDNNADKSSANIKSCAYGIAQLLSTRSDISARDIVILVRRIKSARPLKEHLAQLGLAAKVVGGDGFYQKQEIVDLIAALKLITDPSHELASAIILRSPLVLVKDNDLLIITNTYKKLTIINAEQALNNNLITGDSAQRLRNFLDILDFIKASIHECGVAWALDILIERTDLAYIIGLHDNKAQQWANINKLLFKLSPKKDPYLLIEEYFDNIFTNYKEPQALSSATDDALTIMTIHQSKGLEFKIVVIADSESPLPPSQHDIIYDADEGLVLKPKGRAVALCASSSSHDIPTRFNRCYKKVAQKEKAELCRLLYVALTRAQDELYIACSASTFAEKKRSTTLLGLLLQARDNNLELFDDLCPIKYIDFNYKNLKNNNNILETNYLVYNYNKTSTRWFSSQLRAPDRWSFSLPQLNYKNNYNNLDGELAHNILAQAGSMLTSFGDADHSTIEHILSATFRALGSYHDDQKALNTKKACSYTLGILNAEFITAKKIIFESPLNYWADNNTLIEGFADLVIEYENFIGVIEFKSSLRLICDNNTYVQVFAYAQALKLLYKKPIYFAVMLIGSHEPLMWHPYDNHCQDALSEALRAMANI
jgi:ATP-dependent exoDNAse (exonuclease V) beta subunit